MKQLIIILTALLFLLCLSQPALTQHMGAEPIQSDLAIDKSEVLEYRCAGPSRGGRVTAVRGVVQKPNTFYMGATGGGLWKTEDYGFHWKNISDGYFASPSIGAIAVFLRNPDILYVGTGSDGIRSNVIVGKGIYKSLDAGNTWSFTGLENAGQIGAVEIHPENPDLVYAAVVGQPFRKSSERGVYRSANGGKDWEHILFLSDSTGAVDLEFAPDNPRIIYASTWRAERKPWTIISGGGEDGIFKSTDGGDTWETKTKGLPSGLIGKIDFAVSPDNPARVWALIQADGGEEGIYRSDDYAESWTKVDMPKDVHKSIMYRPFYFTNLSANPQNADNIWSGTKAFWTSRDGGKTWTRKPATHSDHHDLWIHPADTLLMIEGNDGGAAVSRDGGENWSTVFNQPTAEMYSCHVDDQFPYYLYSGQQDNTTIRIPSRKPYLDVLSSNDNHGLNEMMYWERAGGCETGPVVAKPGNPDIIYANCKGSFTVYDRVSGFEQHYYVGAESLYGNHPEDITYRFQRVTPIEVSPHNPDVVYYGSQHVHKTVNGGRSWHTISPDLTAYEPQYRMRSGSPIDEDISGEEYYAVLYAIRESPLKEGLIWTGSNDGLFHITKDGGKNWKNITPEMPSGGRVANIEVSPHQAGKAYFAVYRDYLGDDEPYIYRTEDYGETWVRLTDGGNGIPSDFPTRVVREDPVREGLLFAGTEFGIFISFDDGRKWMPFQRNLPVTPVTDIRIHRGDLVLSTLGRSFWIMDDISVLRYFDLAHEGTRLYKPGDTYGEEKAIYFQLAENGPDSVIRFTFYRDGQLIHDRVEMAVDLPPGKWGLRKYLWDLKYYLPLGENEFEGPKVAPGEYKVSMSRNGKSFEESFIFYINPELEASGTSVQDLYDQEELALSVAKLLVEVKKEISHLENEMNEELNHQAKADLSQRLEKLKTGPRRYDQPKLHDHIEYLYEMITEAPQKPGEDAYQRFEVLKKEFDAYKKNYGDN